MAHVEGQQHPIGIYFKIWGLLFVLSLLSYLVDYFHLQGYLRWGLILTFMMLKAGLIVAVFMHMMWERMAIVCAVLLPPGAVLLFVGMMAVEGEYTYDTRGDFFTANTREGLTAMPEGHGGPAPAPEGEKPGAAKPDAAKPDAQPGAAN